MGVFVAERELPGVTMEQLAAAQRAAIDTSDRYTEEGRPVKYMRSVFMPEESRCMCLFEAPDAETVRAVNDEAQIPYTRIVPAMDLPPQG
ncbi:MAG: DUF4242 domain-containing protein [Chloroflexota bacterium]|nr:DUF4242 domain-containing protein [Chloroflexota bacterium]